MGEPAVVEVKVEAANDGEGGDDDGKGLHDAEEAHFIAADGELADGEDDAGDAGPDGDGGGAVVPLLLAEGVGVFVLPGGVDGGLDLLQGGAGAIELREVFLQPVDLGLVVHVKGPGAGAVAAGISGTAVEVLVPGGEGLGAFDGEDAVPGLDAVAELEDGLEGADGGLAVELFFGVGELVVGDEAGVLFFGVVAPGAEAPPLGDAFLRPEFVDVFRELLIEAGELVCEHHVRGVDGCGGVGGVRHTCWRFPGAGAAEVERRGGGLASGILQIAAFDVGRGLVIPYPLAGWWQRLDLFLVLLRVSAAGAKVQRDEQRFLTADLTLMRR